MMSPKGDDMGFERDMQLNGTPDQTSYNLYKEGYEYGENDKKQGKSFAEGLRELGLNIPEGMDIEGDFISSEVLKALGWLPAQESVAPTSDEQPPIEKVGGEILARDARVIGHVDDRGGRYIPYNPENPEVPPAA